jgi:methylated-DNA-[protein]-cysteine S-methyltransferase
MSDESGSSVYESPLGPLTIAFTADGHLRGIRFPNEGGRPNEGECREETGERAVGPAIAQLDEYFSGKRHGFDLELELSGTPLQLAVWGRLREIPYGETVTYGDLTEELDPAVFPEVMEPYKRIRAVGAEIGRTPIPIVVPCHRVVGADGSLTGYGGGLWRKRLLLELESSQLALL